MDAKESHARRCGERDKIFKLFEFIKFKKFMDVIEPTLLKSSAIRALVFLIFGDYIMNFNQKIIIQIYIRTIVKNIKDIKSPLFSLLLLPYRHPLHYDYICFLKRIE